MSEINSSGRTEIRLSYSKLVSWEYCKQQAYLMTQGKGGPRDSRNFFVGLVVDFLMRDWLAESAEPGWMLPRVPEYFDRVTVKMDQVKWKGSADRKAAFTKSVTMVKKLEPILLERVVPFEFESAKRFSVNVNVPYLDGTPTEITLIGEMDLVVHRPAGVSIEDLKATSSNLYWKKVYGQLYFYDIAWAAMTGSYAQELAIIQPYCKEQLLLFYPTSEEHQVVFSKIMAYCESVWREDFTPKVGVEGCNYCPVRNSCVKFQW